MTPTRNIASERRGRNGQKSSKNHQTKRIEKITWNCQTLKEQNWIHEPLQPETRNKCWYHTESVLTSFVEGVGGVFQHIISPTNILVPLPTWQFPNQHSCFMANQACSDTIFPIVCYQWHSEASHFSKLWWQTPDGTAQVWQDANNGNRKLRSRYVLTINSALSHKADTMLLQ